MKFPKLVKDEADLLKLDPDSKFDCVYGQMTGNCFSVRAKELIEKSCKKVYHTEGYLADATLNGSPIGKERNTTGGNVYGTKTSYWSPIEVFIYDAKERGDKDSIAKLIQFLKGEIKTL